MTTTETTVRNREYRAHRERQRRRILDSAAKLFDGRGIGRITMADIVAAAGVRASTVYQYFANKDEIVWALVAQVIADSRAETEQAMAAAHGPAFAKIAALLEFFGKELVNKPARVRFMAQFDAMYARDWPVERLLEVEREVMPQGFAFLRELVRDGMADGSLRTDLDPDLAMHAVINAAIGAQRRLASLGSRAEVEYGRSVESLFQEAMRVILLGLRA